MQRDGLQLRWIETDRNVVGEVVGAAAIRPFLPWATLLTVYGVTFALLLLTSWFDEYNAVTSLMLWTMLGSQWIRQPVLRLDVRTVEDQLVTLHLVVWERTHHYSRASLELESELRGLLLPDVATV